MLRTGPSLAGLVFALLLAAGVRLGLLWGHDLRGAFGPDAPAAVWSAWIDPLAWRDPLYALLVAGLAVPAKDPVAAALVLSLVAGLVTVGAVWALARAVAGEGVAFAAGAAAAACPLLVEGSLLRGSDAVSVALAWTGLVLAWIGAERVAAARLGSAHLGAVRVGLLLEGVGVRSAGGPLRILAGCLLVGASAAAGPTALPSALFLLAVPALGGRRAVPWLGAGLVLAGGVALPFTGLLVEPLAALPIHGLLAWGANGSAALARLITQANWAEIPLLAAVALLGALVRGPRRGLRVLLFLLGLVALFVPAGFLGADVQPRSLTPALAGWLVLVGTALVPARRRIPGAGTVRSRSSTFVESLPLSLGLTILVTGALAGWDGLANVRADQEGAASPRSPLAGWAREASLVETWREYSICGALELERIAHDLATRLPPGATVLAVPLRDDRIWHLRGPVQARRPDLRFALLDETCCPGGPEACAQGVLEALSTDGGALVSPLYGAARCSTGAVAAGQEAWPEAMEGLLVERRTWYGWTEVARSGAGEGPSPCEVLRGRPPGDPAGP